MRKTTVVLGILTLVLIPTLAFVLLQTGSTPRDSIDSTAAPQGPPQSTPTRSASPEAAPENATAPVATERAPAAAPKPAADHGPGDPIVTGSVRNKAGAPIENARIRVIGIRASRESSDPPTLTAHSDASGQFAVSGTVSGTHPRGSVYVVADAPGHHRHHEIVKLGGRVEFVLDQPCRLTGRVTVAGDDTPCADVTVAVEGIGLPGERSITDESGVYCIDGLEPGTHRVSATSMKHPPLRWVSVVVMAGRETVADISVRRGYVLHGRVVDATTRVPVRGATVQGYDYVPDLRFAESDANGAFHLEGLGEGTRVFIRADGYQLLETRFDAPKQGASASSEAKAFGLTRAALLEGQVLGPDDQPVAGAEVWAHGREKWPNDRTESGRDGTFRLTSVPAGVEVRLTARKAGLARSLSDPMTLRPGEIRRGLVQRLGRGGTITGRLADANNAPVAGGQLRLKPKDWAYNRGFETTSDADGRYCIEAVPADVYDLEVTGESFVGQIRPGLLVTEGVEHANIDFVLDRGLSITGRVVDQQGRPLGQASVNAFPLSPPADQVRKARVTRSDREGCFTLNALAPGRHRVYSIKEGYRRKGRGVVAKAGVRDLVVTMVQRGAAITGQVRHAGTGAPVTEFLVLNHSGSSAYSREQRFSDREGRFELKNLAPGTYHLEARTSDGLASCSVTRVELLPGSKPAPVEILVGPGAALTGQILAPDGSPVARALFEIFHASGRPAGRVARGPTDGAGRFEVASLMPGKYRLRAVHRDWIETERITEVARDRENRVEIKLLGEGGIFEITVQDPDGRPIEGASHILRRPNGVGLRPDRFKTERHLQRLHKALPEDERAALIKRYYSSSANGIIERRFIPPGRCVLEVIKKGYKSGRVESVALAGVRTRLTVTLEPKK